jgi:hypothetical protein
MSHHSSCHLKNQHGSRVGLKCEQIKAKFVSLHTPGTHFSAVLFGARRDMKDFSPAGRGVSVCVKLIFINSA